LSVTFSDLSSDVNFMVK